MPADDVSLSPGFSRRQLIKRSAMVGGTVVWTAPMIQTETPQLEATAAAGAEPHPEDATHVDGGGRVFVPESS